MPNDMAPPLPDSVAHDDARIAAELTRFSRGTDPFAEAVRATRMPMVISNPRLPDNPVVFANDAFCRLSGYRRDEIVGRNCRFLQGPETDPVTIARIRDAVSRAVPIEIDIRNHRKGGEPFWNRLLMAPVRDAHGDLAYFFASQVDVTVERERLAGLENHNAALMAELAGRLHAQKASEARLRFAAQAGRMGIWELDLRTQELTASPEAKVIFGADPNAPLSYAQKRAAIHPDDRARREAAMEHAIATGSDYDIEYRIVLPDGRVEWVQSRAQVVRAATGEAIRVAGVAQNTTAQRNAQISLELSNECLEQRVAEAVAERETIGEALRQAQKMEAVGQLTGGIAHDFNNLLAGIMGSLEFLQRRIETGRTEGMDRYATAAMTSAQRATALTQRLLAFARRQPLDPRRVDANRLVAAMDDLLRRTLGPAIHFEMHLAGALWPTMCDPHQLDSVILNLAINARDAMPGGGRLTIETENAVLDAAYARRQGGEVRPGPYILISVTDTGTGMTPDVIAKAFDPFFTTKPTGQGTGLGLSMVYGFVKQSEGHVSIYSEPGRGTTFRLYLPRYLGDESGEMDSAAAPSPDLSAHEGETVLVVDDEPTVRMLVTETLEELGYAAIEAVDAQTGLAALQRAPRIDLLVTDVGLPGLNGRQLADAARVLRPELKVLFMTGYAHNAAVGNGALDPGMEIITKPFALDALAKKIRDMIEAP
jgi:PAS domain S-box-containing protein